MNFHRYKCFPGSILDQVVRYALSEEVILGFRCELLGEAVMWSPFGIVFQAGDKNNGNCWNKLQGRDKRSKWLKADERERNRWSQISGFVLGCEGNFFTMIKSLDCILIA